MKKYLLSLLVVLSSNLVFGQFNSTNLKAEYGSENVYTYGNLRLYPVRANDVFLALHDNIGDYTILAEAVEKKKIVVTEVSNSGTVNTLFAENLSSDSIYVMAGEIVKGCLFYTSFPCDPRASVDSCGRRVLYQKNNNKNI